MRYHSLLSVVGFAALVHGDDDTSSGLRGGGRRTSGTNEMALLKRMIITHKHGQRDACHSSMTIQSRSSSSSLRVEHEFDSLDAFVVTGTPEELASLEANDNVLSVEEDVPRYPLVMDWDASEDPKNTETMDKLPYGIGLVGAPEVWQNGIRGEGVTVCVIDSGVDSRHEDLDRLSGLEGSPNFDWHQDTSGHGTHVTGTISASENDSGVIGVAPKASIYVVRAFGSDGGFVYSSGLVDAANRCVQAGAKIISMSIGGPLASSLENNAFSSFISQGILPIAAAGNDGSQSFSFPASYDGVMSVGAVDSNKRVASFSQRNSQVDIAGPGVNVLSTLPTVYPCEICSQMGSFGYGAISGTSMATPHVSGVAALLWSLKPPATAAEIYEAIASTAQDLGTAGKDSSYGWGLVQALKAAEFLNGGPLDGTSSGGDSQPATNPPTTPPVETPTCPSGEDLFRLVLQTDRYGAETSWELRRSSDGAYVSSSPLESSREYVEQLCLPTSDCYTFTVFDKKGDGLCCNYGQGSYSVAFGGDVVQTGGDFSRAEEVSFGSCGQDAPVDGPCQQGLVPIDFFLRTDSYASETSLRLVDQDGTILGDYSGLRNNQDYILTECVAPDGCYTLSIFDAAGNGLGAGIAGGFIVSFNGVEQDRSTFFGSEVSVEMGSCA